MRPRACRAPASGRSLAEEQRLARYNALHRNKRALALNLKHPEGRDLFYRLADNVDVVMEGYRPGVVKRLGVDYDTLKQRNPGWSTAPSRDTARTDPTGTCRAMT